APRRRRQPAARGPAPARRLAARAAGRPPRPWPAAAGLTPACRDVARVAGPRRRDTVALMSDDFELLDAWRGGDLQAGSALFDRHFESIHRFLRNKVGDDTDEVMQRTLLACVETRDRFRGASTFLTYLFGVARLELLAHYRRRRKLSNELDIESKSFFDLAPSPSTVVAKHKEQMLL